MSVLSNGINNIYLQAMVLGERKGKSLYRNLIIIIDVVAHF